MLKNARELIEKYARGKRVAAAVSGGEDSMALISLLSEYARAGFLSLIAVNVDHCIRPNSARDSEFVREYCEREKIELIAKKADIPAMAKKSGRGLESEAHFYRKSVFASLTESGKADLVATAHHARDNAETVLMHLFRGAGLKGLGGMNVCAHNIFRPFLTTPKSEISAYVHSNGIKYVTDESNFDTDYDRNYIRHEILPLIEARYPSFERAVTRATVSLKAANEFLSAQVNASEIITNSDGSVSIGEDKLEYPYIVAALERLGKTSDLYMNAVECVRGLTKHKDCARADVGDGIVAAREYGKITFYRKEEVCVQEVPFVLRGGSESVAFGNRQIVLKKISSGVIPSVAEESSLQKTLVFCADAIPDTAVWRTRRAGDKFTPYGGGTRKLKEYLIDKKVPQRLRDGLILLCAGNEVLMIAGIEISDKLKVTDASTNIFTAEL